MKEVEWNWQDGGTNAQQELQIYIRTLSAEK